MDKQDYLRKLEQALELDPGFLKGDEVIQDLPGWDSMATLAILAMADQEFGVMLVAREVLACRTVVDLEQLIHKARDERA